MRKVVKVRVPVTVEINVERWLRYYGIEEGEAAMRQYVYGRILDSTRRTFQHLDDDLREPVVQLRIG